MSRLEIILLAISVISILFNIFIAGYTRRAIAELLSISEELGDIQEMVSSFANHVKAVYEMEMFYGDATLKGLMEHAISFNEQLETFEYVSALTTDIEDKKEGTNVDEQNDREAEDSPQEKKEN